MHDYVGQHTDPRLDCEDSPGMKATLFAALALCAASASAQSVYTSVGLDGHKTFSDRAGTIAGAEVSEAAPAADVQNVPGRRFLVSSRLSARVNAHEAERRLALAERKRSDGAALQYGESERVPGGIVVNARYWVRQQGLDLEVEQAQRRSHETQKLQLARTQAR
jgi:hypothetical protein